MTRSAVDQPRSWPTYWVAAAGCYVAAAGVVTLLGWLLDIRRLTDWKDDGISMFVNAALCATLGGVALVLASRPLPAFTAIRVLGSCVAGIGGLTVVEHLTGLNLRLDTILAERPWGQLAAAAPMRMGPPASLAFLAGGTALVLLTCGGRARRASAYLGTGLIALGMLFFTGHLYGASPLYTLPRLTGIAMQTASVVLMFGVGLVSAVAEAEPMRTLMAGGAAGLLVRRALPLFIAISLTLGAARLAIQEAGLVDARFGTALRTVIESGLFAGLLWWAARRLREHEQAPGRREAELHVHDGLLAAIVESSDDAIISKDLTGTITSWNQGAERLFGYSAAEAIGQPVTMLIPRERHNEEPEILARIRRGLRIDHYETVRRGKNGALLDISITVSPVVDETGTIVGASKIARDIGEKKRTLEQQRVLLQAAENARREAEQASRAKDEFLAMLGHELRNPLAAVRNAIAAAELDGSAQSRALEIARRQSDQLTHILDDLLDVSRITQGRVRLRKEPLDLTTVVQRSVESIRPLMGERGLSIVTHIPATPLPVDGDAARLEQALANLLTNAAKYTDPGGTVTVTAEQRDASAVVRVHDSGIGISPALLPRVFELFTQGERALDRAQGGLGIGLTVVRRLVELHGGSVDVSSAGIGKGAEFAIRLPLAAAESHAVIAVPSLDGAPPNGPARVLVVEDHPDTAESLQMVLEGLGHKVRVTHDGRAALRAAEAETPDIMLVDIGLPGMNGYELATAIRREARWLSVALVALTGYGRPEDKAQALSAGFDHHLAKPVEPGALRDLIARCGQRSESEPLRTRAG